MLAVSFLPPWLEDYLFEDLKIAGNTVCFLKFILIASRDSHCSFFDSWTVRKLVVCSTARGESDWKLLIFFVDPWDGALNYLSRF